MVSDFELVALAAQVDEQLDALQLQPADPAAFRGVGDIPAAPEQQAVIERVSGESFETFWAKYRRHARRDRRQPDYTRRARAIGIDAKRPEP